jgi:hypothetical protein
MCPHCYVHLSGCLWTESLEWGQRLQVWVGSFLGARQRPGQEISAPRALIGPGRWAYLSLAQVHAKEEGGPDVRAVPCPSHQPNPLCQHLSSSGTIVALRQIWQVQVPG